MRNAFKKEFPLLGLVFLINLELWKRTRFGVDDKKAYFLPLGIAYLEALVGGFWDFVDGGIAIVPSVVVLLFVDNRMERNFLKL